MRKPSAVAGSALFVAVAPGVVAGIVERQHAWDDTRVSTCLGTLPAPCEALGLEQAVSQRGVVIPRRRVTTAVGCSSNPKRMLPG